MAGNPEDYSLDVAEPQVALHFPHDANGVVWHHRLLISKLGPGRWIGASPDLELEIIDYSSSEASNFTKTIIVPR